MAIGQQDRHRLGPGRGTWFRTYRVIDGPGDNQRHDDEHRARTGRRHCRCTWSNGPDRTTLLRKTPAPQSGVSGSRRTSGRPAERARRAGPGRTLRSRGGLLDRLDALAPGPRAWRRTWPTRGLTASWKGFLSMSVMISVPAAFILATAAFLALRTRATRCSSLGLSLRELLAAAPGRPCDSVSARCAWRRRPDLRDDQMLGHREVLGDRDSGSARCRSGGLFSAPSTTPVCIAAVELVEAERDAVAAERVHGVDEESDCPSSGP
jgi:hypothetical protein